MTFKQEFLAALQAGKPDEVLLKIVREWQGQFASQREVYDILQEIWLEQGFDERSGGGPIQDSLEYVMEKIWYECPA
jgi:hypothetical protein